MTLSVYGAFWDAFLQIDYILEQKVLRLKICWFVRFWVQEFPQQTIDILRNTLSCHVDQPRNIAFNTCTIGSFFVQFTSLFSTCNITASHQICNLDETIFSPGHDIVSTNTNRVITKENTPVFKPKSSFFYTNIISIFIYIFADVSQLCLAAIFSGVLEARL